jgi:uncharacterized protein
MLPEIEQLLVLQDRDRKIRALKLELKVAPGQRKEFDDNLAAANRNLEAAKLKAKEIEVDRKKLEIEAEAKRTSIAKFQTQKFQTRKNEEFQALNNEIERYEKDVREIEDRELDLMESAEKAKAAIAEAERQAKEVKALVDRQLADLAAKTTAVERHLHELEAERARLAEPVEEDLLDTFTRLFHNKSEAVVQLDHDVCTGCHMKVTTQTAVKVRGNREIVHCEQCGRILYATH